MSFFPFILRRLLALIPLLLFLSVISYILIIQGGGGLIRLFAIDQINIGQALMEVELGLDQSPVINYFRWLEELVKGNIGVIDDRVGGETGLYSYVMERLGKSLYLVAAGLFLSLSLGLFFGIWAVFSPKSLLTHFIHLFISLGVTIPNYVLGFFLIFFFSVRLRLFPVGGFEGLEAGLGDLKGFALLWDRLRHLFLPALTLGLPAAAVFTNQVMQGIQEVVNMEFIRTAHAKGLSFMKVLIKHVLPNGLSAVMAGFFTLIPHFIGWLVIVEVIFSWPGLAFFAFRRGLEGDFYVILVVLIFTALFVLTGGMVTEIIHALLDPRIREKTTDNRGSLKLSKRELILFCLVLLLSLLYFPMRSLLERIPLSSFSIVVGLLLFFYSFIRLLKNGKRKGRERPSFSCGELFSGIGLFFFTFWRERNPSFLLGFFLLLFILVLISWPWEYSNLFAGLDARTLIRDQRHPPSTRFLLGTDEVGHDVLFKTLYNGRETLYVGFRMLSIVILVGGGFGILAPYLGGFFDLFCYLLVQLFSSFPVYFLVMLALPFSQASGEGIIYLLGFVGSLQLFTVIRIRTISIKKQEYVEGAYALGVSHLGVIKRYILPNLLPYFLSEGSLIFGQLIVYLSALGFLGFIPWGGWGQQMAQGRYYEWWIKLGPSLALMLLVFSLYLLGRGVLQAIDPFHVNEK